VWIFRVLYIISAVLLSLYGLNSLLLTLLYLWPRRGSSIARRAMSAATSQAEPVNRAWPPVTVQLPIYNEWHTVERLLGAVAKLDYPRDLLQVQVLDDSTDETRALAAELVQDLRQDGLDIVHLIRKERSGYKAGALAAGLPSATGELIAILDADFVPPRSFLREVVPHLADPGVGCVQTRWGHANRNYSPLTRVQALMLDGHFVVEQGARSRAGFPISFNGTAGVWRRACIEDAGGWTEDTLTEDLDLSYRAQLCGWRLVYLPTVHVPGELPVQIGAFKRQQARWAQGSIQTAVKTFGPLLRSRLSWLAKLQGVLHLTAYLGHPLMLLNLLLLLPMRALPDAGLLSLGWTQAVTPLWMIAALGPPVLYAVAQASDGRGWMRRLSVLPLLILIGIGVALNNAWGVLKALLGVQQGFLRTPKFAVCDRNDTWADSSYALGIDASTWAEMALAAYSAALVFVPDFAWSLAPWLLLCAAGFGYVAGTGLIQSLRRARAWRRAAGRRSHPIPAARKGGRTLADEPGRSRAG
jgi:cellulose synthase/poly-beta-1,6-N-acetylglucosamine synthase-like glycosyltransferase